MHVQDALVQGHFELAADLLRFVQPLGEPDASVPVASAPQPHALGSQAGPQVCCCYSRAELNSQLGICICCAALVRLDLPACAHYGCLLCCPDEA